MLKRGADVLLATCGLLLLAPLLFILALLVRLTSPGPVIFRQQRVGRGGESFEILKFRTMRHAPAGSGALITSGSDPRITRVGAILRRFKLDELPQLVNVLRGEMSLVGPRPEVPRYVALYPPELRQLVLSVRPGLTDEAAILFRDEERLLALAPDPEQYYIEEILPRKLALYAAYARCHSLAGDLGIIRRTIARILGAGQDVAGEPGFRGRTQS